jgi:hypothetical protein
MRSFYRVRLGLLAPNYVNQTIENLFFAQAIGIDVQRIFSRNQSTDWSGGVVLVSLLLG